MKLRNVVMAVVLVASMAFLSGCMTTIEPGYVGIKVNKVGDNRGVSKENLCAGWVFYVPLTTRIIEYPVFNQRVVWTADKREGNPNDESITFQTRDNVPCNIDVAVNYTLKEEKVPEFYTKFRADKIDMFTHGYMRDQARNAATQIGSEYDFDAINGNKKEEFLSKLNTQLKSSVAPYGVEVSNISLIGAIRVPENLKNAINARVQSIQDAIKSENDLRKMKVKQQQ
jgi:regulator of protease activity HflC (stomatin/prohibitin superfamily)